jgi:LPS-assembly protein
MVSKKNITRQWRSARGLAVALGLGMILPRIEAEEARAVCGPVNPLEPLHAQLPAGNPGDSRIFIDADRATMVSQGNSLLEGNVVAQRGTTYLLAPQLLFDRSPEVLAGESGLTVLTDVLDLHARVGRVATQGGTGRFEDAQFYLRKRPGRGVASTIRTAQDGPSQLREVRFTTCPVDQGDGDWYLRAQDVKLDFESGRGTARNAQVIFKDVPLIYTPWLAFPITNERMSGFLSPRLGTANDRGLDLATPYYWNIAPEQDATFTPRVMSKRGLQMQSEYRYLSPYGRGMLYNEYLPNDQILGEDRTLWSYRHHARPALDWQADVDFTSVSDIRYFEDLSTTLTRASSRYLQRRAALGYGGPQWDLLLRAQEFQLVDPRRRGEPEPFQRLPQLVARTRNPQPLLGPLAYDLRTEAVRFGRDGNRQGERWDTELGLSTPWDRGSYFINPRLAYRQTQYSLAKEIEIDDQGSPTRGLPMVSVDSGLRFERDLAWSDKGWLQTLEPRLFYLYVPEREQDDLPVFDTRLPEFDFLRLFDTNRYVGADRQSSANQVTTALTSAVRDADSGALKVEGTLGRITRMTPSKTLLPDEGVSEVGDSTYLAEAAAYPRPDTRARFQIEWDSEDQTAVQQLAEVRYQPESRKIIGLSYRLRRDLGDPLEQVDVMASWPLTRELSAVGRWNYSLRDDQDLETLVGVEYRSCCWAVQVAGRRYVRNIDEVDQGIYLQFELSGLGRLGDGLQSFLNRAMVGNETMP